MRSRCFFVTSAALLAVVASSTRARAEPTPGVFDPRGPAPPVMVYAPPPPEAPPPRSRFASDEPPEDPAYAKLLNGGGEIQLGALAFQPDLGRESFSGEGRRIGFSNRETFRHLGRELGVNTPLMLGGELAIYYMRRYFAIGALGFFAGNASGASAVPRADAGIANLVGASGVTGGGGGVDLAIALPLGPVALRLGGVFGARAFSLPMTGFEQTTCRNKGRTYPCDETASTGPLMYLSPRLRIEVPVGGANGAFFFGGYVGMEVIGGSSPTAGLFFGMQTPHAELRP